MKKLLFILCLLSATAFSQQKANLISTVVEKPYVVDPSIYEIGIGLINQLDYCSYYINRVYYTSNGTGVFLDNSGIEIPSCDVSKECYCTYSPGTKIVIEVRHWLNYPYSGLYEYDTWEITIANEISPCKGNKGKGKNK